MVGTPLKLPASVAALRRNLATVGQDELHTALYKTTQVDDGLPPKEKHVRLLVRAAATEAERARLIAALGKRLQLCRDARTAPLAAKASAAATERRLAPSPAVKLSLIHI